MMNSYRTRLLATSLMVGATALATPAFAQDAATATPTPSGAITTPAGVQSQDSAPPAQDTSAGEIVVTGTLISNPNLVASSPVSVVGQEEIQLRQSNTAEQILRDLPGAVPSIGSAVNNGNGGASFVNLRGLGSNRNLVLLDGSRIAPSGLGGQVDLNNIPLALVERVDTLTGGAATTYGADAVSGVVNFITRSDFAGMEASVSNQITEDGDGNYIRADITVGANFDDGKGNAVFSIGYQQADPVYQGERSVSRFQYNSFTGRRAGSDVGVPTAVLVGNDYLQIGPNGTLPALGTTAYQDFNFNPFNIFQTPFERFNMYGAGHYEVADGIEVYTRGLFSKNTVNTIVAPSGLFGEDVTIPYSNPYLPANLRGLICADNGLTSAQCAAAAADTSATAPTFTTSVLRRATEVGPRISEFTTSIFDYKAGVRIGLTDGINLDVSGAYGESERRQTLKGYTLLSRIQQAVNATNTTTCVVNTNGCVPLNLFGADGSITPAMVNFITGESTTTVRSSLAQARALLSGTLGATSPWADEAIGFAAGAEYRKYRASQASDLLAQTPGELGGAGGAAPNINGGYEVYEGYGELIAPLVTEKPFFHSLTIEGGVRYSHYKVFSANQPTFNATTYKAGGSWEPVEGIKVRGNYQRAVRAPNVAELFSPVTTGLTNLATDPCAGTAPVGNANLTAVCLAQGAPAASIGVIQNPNSGQAAATGGGNPNLRPEKSDSYTVGVVLQPRGLISGLTITADYYHIKVNGAVSSPTPGDVIAACFGNLTAASATSAACTTIRRDPRTGRLSGSAATTPGLPTPLSNLGTLLTDGIDLGVNYRRDLGFAKLNLSFQGNWTNRSKFKATPSALNRECTGYYSINCGSIQPEFYWNQRTTLSFERFDVSLLWRHIDGNEYEPLLAANRPAYTGPLRSRAGVPIGDETYNFGRIKAYDYFDLSTRLTVNENVDFTVTVTNLFDKDPPQVGNTIGSTSYNSGNTYPSTYDALGRRYSVGARLKF